MSLADIEAARRALAALCAAPDPVNRATFAAWPASRQSAHCLAGGRIVDDARTARPRSPHAGAPPVRGATRLDFLASENADKLRKF